MVDNKEYDVFLCYNKEDKHFVTEIYNCLTEYGLNPWFDDKSLKPGFSWVNEISEKIKNVKAIAVLIGKKGLSQWYSKEINEILIEINNKNFPIIPVILPDCPSNPEVPVILKNIAWVDFRKNDVDPFKSLIFRITGRKTNKIVKHNLPFRRNPNFTGREKTLEYLRNTMISGNNNVLAITGMGGVGKTQIAVEYVYRFLGCYKLIWWVDAEKSIYDDFVKFVYEMKLINGESADYQNVLNLAHVWMNTNDDWLFIFDGVNDRDDIVQYIPAHVNGHIIITSRNRNWSDLLHRVEIDLFNKEESMNFLKMRTEQKDNGFIGLLADELGYMPLALELAGSFIETNKKSFQEYLDLYKKHKLKLLNQSEIYGYTHAIASTWDISLAKVEREDSRQLLYICAFLSPDEIPKDIFSEGNECLPELLKNGLLDKPEFDTRWCELTSYSLIEDYGSYISIHPLIQEFLIQRLSELEEYKTWCKYSLNLMYKLFSFDAANYKIWDRCKTLLPHVLSIILRAEKFDYSMEEVAYLYNQAGSYLARVGEYEKAEPLLKRALEIREILLGVNHPDTATSLNNLAKLFYVQGKYEEAEPLFKRALEKNEQVFGENHPFTVTLLNNLAELYESQGKYEEAESIYKRALEISGQVLGANHPSTATLLNNLAGLYERQGKYKEAEPLIKEGLEIRERVLGTNHPDIAISLNNLAGLYESQGKYVEAEPIYKRALEISESILGAHHPSTATLLNELAFLYSGQGKYEEAEPLYQGALEIRERILGANHPDTATTLNNLALLYTRQGKYEEAEPLYKRALEIRESILGANHPDTATSLNNLALLYARQGKYEEAEPLYKSALEIRGRVLGINHPSTATSLNNLAGLFSSQKKYADAEPLYERALEINEKVLEANHPYIAISLNNLAGLYESQGKYEEAEPLYRKALEISEIKLGASHLDTAISLNNLAFLYSSQGKYEEAEPLYKRALGIRERVSGAIHPDTATSLNNLAFLYYNQGKYEDAEPLYKRALKIRERVLGTSHPDTVTSLNNLARLYYNQGKYEEAERIYKRALEISESILGANHPNVAKTLNDLAVLYYKQKIYDTSENYFKKALRIREIKQGLYHEEVMNLLQRLAQIYSEQGRESDYKEIVDKIEERYDEIYFERNINSEIYINFINIKSLNFLNDINWEIQPQMNILLGRNGYGKTYLFRFLLTILYKNKNRIKEFTTTPSNAISAQISLGMNQENFEINLIESSFKSNFGRVPLLAISNSRTIDKSLDSVFEPPSSKETDLVRHGAYNFIREKSESNKIQRFLHSLCNIYWESNKSFEGEIFKLLQSGNGILKVNQSGSLHYRAAI